MADEAFDAAQRLPLTERLVHSLWKVRQAAYLELEKRYAEAFDGIVLSSGALVANFLQDKNVVSKEKGLSSVLVFYDRCDTAKRLINSHVEYIVECIGSTRATTASLAKEIILMMMEITSVEQIIPHLIKGTEHKTPKVSADCEINPQSTYGLSVFPTPLVMKMLPKWFEHTSAPVREQTLKLAKEMCRWTGEKVIKKQLEGLRAAQLNDVTKAFEEINAEEKPKATRFLRSHVHSNEPEEVKVVELDEYSLSEAVDILAKLPPTFLQDLEEAKKWSDKKEKLDLLAKLADTPKISASGDFGPLVRALKKTLSHNNVRVVESSILCIGVLAKGLRAEFAPHARSLVRVLLEKFKERKEPVVKALQDALLNMHPYCFTISDILEDIIEVCQIQTPIIQSKTSGTQPKATTGQTKPPPPSVKQQILILMTSLLKLTPKSYLIPKRLQPICTVVMELMEDKDETVRNLSYQNFGTVIAIVGEKVLQGFMAKLDKPRKDKIQEMTPQDLPPALPFPACVTGVAQPTTHEQKAPNKDRESNNGGVPKKITETTTRKKREKPKEKEVKDKAETKPRDATQRPDPSTPPAEESKAYMMTKDQATKEAQKIFSFEPEVWTQLKHQDWKQKLEAISYVKETVEINLSESDVSAQTPFLIGFLQHYPGFECSNIEITSEVVSLVSYIVGLSHNLSQSCAPIVRGLANKLSEEKLKSSIIEIFVALCTKQNPTTVVKELCSVAIKTPNAVAEIVEFMTNVLVEFGAQAVDINLFVSLSVKILANASIPVKKATIKMLCEVYKYVGNSLRSQLSNLKPAVLSAISKEFDKLANVKPTRPIRKVQPAPRVAENNTDCLPSSDPEQRTDNFLEGKRTIVKVADGADGTMRLSTLNESVSVSATIEPPVTLVKVQEGQLFVASGKQSRLSEDKKMPWPKTQIRSTTEHVSLLRSQMRECVSADLHPKLFSLDSSIWLEGLHILSDNISKYPRSAIDNLDVILKWFTWKLTEAHVSNNEAYDPLLVFLKQVFALLAAHEYQLQSQELEIFLFPFLDIIGCSERIGERCIKMVECLKVLPKLYASKELFSIYTDFFQSPIAAKYAKLVCLNEMKSLFELSGASVCSPAVHLPILSSSFLNDTDSKVKGGALTVLYAVFRVMGDEVWKHLSLTPAQRATLERKFQNTLTPSTTKTVGRSPDTQGPSTPQQTQVDRAEKLAREQREREAAEKRAREEAERLAREEAERRKEAARREEAERQAREQAEKEAREREQREREAAEKKAREQREREAAEKRVREEAARREEAERQAREQAEKEAREREQRAREAEREREEAELQAREQAKKLAREQQERREERAREVAKQQELAERKANEAKVVQKQSPKRNREEYENTNKTHTNEPAKQPRVEDFFCEIPEPCSNSPLAKLEKKSSSLSFLLARTDSVLNRALEEDDSFRADSVPTTFDLELEKITDSSTNNYNDNNDNNDNNGNNGNNDPLLETSTSSGGSTAYLDSANILATVTPVLPSRTKQRVTAPVNRVSSLVRQLNNAKENSAKIHVYHVISQFLRENESTAGLVLDPLIMALASHLETLFQLDKIDEVCKPLLSALTCVFSKKTFAQSLTESALLQFIKSLLSCLLNDSVNTLKDGKVIKSSFNKLMVLLMDHVDRTTCFLILLKELCNSIPLPIPASTAGSPYPKYTTLVMKCLLNLIKQLPEHINNVDVASICLEIHIFLTHYPPSQWRRASDSSPLNIVKTLLNSIVKCKKAEVVKYLHLIPVNNTPTPAIVTYVNHLLQQIEPGTQVGPNTTESGSTTATTTPSTTTTKTATTSTSTSSTKTTTTAAPGERSLPRTKSMTRLTKVELLEMIQSSSYCEAPGVSPSEAKDLFISLFQKSARSETRLAALADLHCLRKHLPELFTEVLNRVPEKLREFVEGTLKLFAEVDQAQENSQKVRETLTRCAPLRNHNK